LNFVWGRGEKLTKSPRLLDKDSTDRMEYAKGFPCMYGMEGGGAIEVNGSFVHTVKHGSSWHIANRKSGAKTYLPKKPIFNYVLVLDPNSFKNEDDLYALDAEFVVFVKARGLGEYYINEGGGTEWFLKSCPVSFLELRKEFLQCMGIPIIAVIEDDPYPIYDLNENDKRVDEEEQRKIYRAKQSASASFEKFCSVFLPGKLPRRIQIELWYRFKRICESPGEIDYRGIVQWPTGTGKTIAMLMLIVLVAERCKRRNTHYRGLLISPKNDIFNTISGDFKKLSEFGIKICDGSNGKFSTLYVPRNEHVLVMACHQALTNNKGMRTLPPMGHIHYDEVHRITGEECFNLLKELRPFWKTEFLTGTSATPKTCSHSQHEKLKELFGEGDPLHRIHCPHWKRD
jgi:Type III restriction enzyme, res subunit